MAFNLDWLFLRLFVLRIKTGNWIVRGEVGRRGKKVKKDALIFVLKANPNQLVELPDFTGLFSITCLYAFPSLWLISFVLFSGANLAFLLKKCIEGERIFSARCWFMLWDDNPSTRTVIFACSCKALSIIFIQLSS